MLKTGRGIKIESRSDIFQLLKRKQQTHDGFYHNTNCEICDYAMYSM